MVKEIGLPGQVTGFWRLLIGALGWNIVSVVRRRRIDWNVLRLTALPGLLFGINLMLFFTGVTKTAIAHAEFMGVLSPLIVIPAAAWQHGERIKRNVLGLGAVAIVGVIMIIAFSARKQGKSSLAGDLMVLVAVFTWATYLLIAKKIRLSMDTSTFMAGSTIWAAVVAAPFAFSTQKVTAASGKGWVLLFVMALTSGMLAHGLLAFSQRQVPLGVITLLQLGQPPLGTLWAVVFLHESVRPLQVVGMALVLSAVAGVALRTARGT